MNLLTFVTEPVIKLLIVNKAWVGLLRELRKVNGCFIVQTQIVDPFCESSEPFS